MINTLNIGGYIYNQLSTITEAKTYPLVADNDAKFPFIIYKRTNLYSNGCKDGYYEDQAVVEVTVVSDNYAKSVDIANSVRKVLEMRRNTYDNMTISDCHLTSAREDFTNNAYVQTMQYQLEIN